MKSLIVNADDFGMSSSINQGIIQAHREGIVTSTTIMANGAAFAEARDLALDNPKLGVGVHLNLTEGPAILEATRSSSITDDVGNFLGTSVALSKRLLLSTVDNNVLVNEFKAQIQKVLDSGIKPTHVDSHMHIHSIPQVYKALVEAARSLRIYKFRYPKERKIAKGSPIASVLRSKAVSFLTSFSSIELKTTTSFKGPQFMGILNDQTLMRVIADLDEGCTELMCHPSLDCNNNGYIRRDEELQALTSSLVKEELRKNNIHLTHFGELL